MYRYAYSEEVETESDEEEAQFLTKHETELSSVKQERNVRKDDSFDEEDEEEEDKRE